MWVGRDAAPAGCRSPAPGVAQILSGAWALYCLYHNPGMFWDLAGEYSAMSCGLMAFSCGYFIADLVLMLLLGTFLDVKFYLVHVHHVVVLSSLFAGCLCNLFSANLMTIALVCEVNNWFLHGGKLLRRFGHGDGSWPYSLNNVGFYLSFFTTRLAPHLFIVVYVGLHREILAVLWQYAMCIVCSNVLVAIDASMLWDFYVSRRRGGGGGSAAGSMSGAAPPKKTH